MKIINIKDNVSLDDFLKEKETPSLLRAIVNHVTL